MTAGPSVQLADYQLHLEGFEGPLDVLLRLIEKEQLEISNLSLVAVTDNFLAHVANLDRPSPQLLAEFLRIASRLLVLKTRALLPRQLEEEDEEVDDLAQQLRDYQRAKRMARELRERDESSWRAFVRIPTPREVNVQLELPEPDELRRRFLSALARQPQEAEVAPIRRQISIGEMARRILSVISLQRLPRRFTELVGSQERDVVIAGFVALLSLWNRHQVDIDQNDLFGDIMVHPGVLEDPQ